MACGGCNRRKKNSGTRTKPKTTTKKVVINSFFPDLTNVQKFNRKKKCSRCPFITSSGLTGRCKKGNRMISKIVDDPGFKCPIKRF